MMMVVSNNRKNKTTKQQSGSMTSYSSTNAGQSLLLSSSLSTVMTTVLLIVATTMPCAQAFSVAPPLSTTLAASRITTSSSFPVLSAIEYNDFDFVIGDDNSGPGRDSETKALQERVSAFRKEQVQTDSRLAKNWRQGHWKVQGFALDKFDPRNDILDNQDSTTKSTTTTTTHVSKIVVGLDADSVVVGRTDGSVFVVELGTEFCARFVAQLTVQPGLNDTLSVSTEMVREDSLSEPMNDNDDMGGLDAVGELSSEVPFEVTHQFVAHARDPITSLRTMETEDGPLLVTGSKSGKVMVWSIPEDEDDDNKKVLPKYEFMTHSDEIVAMEAVSMTGQDEEPFLLLTASIDGTLALWDIRSGDMIYQCEMRSDDGTETVPITSASSGPNEIFLGLASGHVVAYAVADIVESGSVGETCPVPNCRFLAHDRGVSAIKVAGEGSMGQAGVQTTVLLTGGNDGVVKQWEIFSRPATANTPARYEHWPRLENQKMKRRAHIFRGHDEMPITDLAAVDEGKFLSAGQDGSVRAWSPSKGTELFRMDGFTAQLNSLCLEENLLITDGMEHYVCIHDFDVTDDDYTDGFELEP